MNRVQVNIVLLTIVTSVGGHQPPPPSIDGHPHLRFLPQDSCGLSRSEPRIYGGKTTRLFETPWLALLGYVDGEHRETVFRCSGTIINELYIMTAAHCLVDLQEGIKLSFARVGEYNLKTERDCESVDRGTIRICANRHRDVGIERIHVHRGYTSTNYHNDIGLVRLKSPLKFENQISVLPICLPLTPSLRPATDSDRGTAIGWGTTASSVWKVEPSPVPSKVKLPLLPLERCRRVYDASMPPVEIWYKQICAGGEAGRDVCTMDSGGPLQKVVVVDDIDDGDWSARSKVRTVQLGVISFGVKDCGSEDAPSVYTNVAYYLDWILDTIKE